MVSDMSALIFFTQGIPNRAQPADPAFFSLGSTPEQHSWLHSECGEWPCLWQSDSTVPGPLYLCGMCTSSLDIAHFFVQRNILPLWGSVLVAEQASGRGQLGRTWHSAPGNIFAAVRLPMTPPFDGTAAAPALGAYLAATLRTAGYPIWFKWPNDLVIVENGRACKVCGILLEERQNTLIAGIGINLVSPPPTEALREGHALPGGCLPGHPAALPLWRQLVSGIKFCYEQNPPMCTFNNSSTPGISWRSLAETWLLYKDKPVAVLDGPDDNVAVRGTLRGLAPDGGVCLQTHEGLRSLHSGSLIPD